MKGIDKISLQKIRKLYNSEYISLCEVGIGKGLQQIHKYIFDSLYNFTVEIRTIDKKTILDSQAQFV